MITSRESCSKKMTDIQDVIIFKTSVQEHSDILKLKKYLDGIIKDGSWNFDLEDCDKILRVENNRHIIKSIISLLSKNGFECIELED